MTEESIVERLIRIYKNEKNTMTLLPYDKDVTDTLKHIIPKQIEYMSRIKSNTVIKFVYEQDLERVKYFMKEYLKARLSKIESNFFVRRDHLSQEEAAFLDKIIEIYKKRGIYHESSINSKECVGFIVLCDRKMVQIDGNLIEIHKGDFFVAALADVIDLLYSGEIALI
jgi:GINS complex subunit 4